LSAKTFALSGEREKEAETLYSKMDSDPDKEDMVIKDIHIRHFAHLNMSETCEPKKQAIVDNPPLASEGTSWVDPDPKLINQWQTSLLVDGQPFCNFIEYYECDLMKQVIIYGRISLSKFHFCHSSIVIH
jgi:hypothetical protein